MGANRFAGRRQTTSNASPLPQPHSASSAENLVPASSSTTSGSSRIEPPIRKPLAVLVNTRARDLNAELHLAGAALNPERPERNWFASQSRMT